MRFPTLHNEGHCTSDTVTLDKFLNIIYADNLTKIHNFSKEYYKLIYSNEKIKKRDKFACSVFFMQKIWEYIIKLY